MNDVKQNMVACDYCHAIKKKCSGGSPPCERCLKNGLTCHFPTIRKKNQRLLDIETKLKGLEVSAKQLPSPAKLIYLASMQEKEKYSLKNIVPNMCYRNLVNIYLSVHHRVYPFINPPRIEKEFYKDPQRSFLLNAICCLSSRYVQNKLRSQKKESLVPLLQENTFYLRAIENLKLIVSDTSLEIIQGLLILNLLECGCLLFQKASMHLAMAISKAQSMGLHYINSSKSLGVSGSLKIEMRAVWAMCIYFDCATSIYTNKLYTTSEMYDEFDEFPSDLPPLIHSSASENPSSESSELPSDPKDYVYSDISETKSTDLILMEGTYLHVLIAKYKSRAMILRRRAFRGEIPFEELGFKITQMYFQTMDKIPSHITIDYMRYTSYEKDPLIISFFYLRLSIAADRLVSILTEATHRGLSAQETLVRIREVANIFRLLSPVRQDKWESYEAVNWIPGLVLLACVRLIEMFPRFVSNPNVFGPVLAQHERFSAMYQRCSYHWPLLTEVIPNIVNLSLKFIS